VQAAELWQANCSIVPWAVVYRSRTAEQLRLRAARRRLLRGLLLALGLGAAACLNPKTDDLPGMDENAPGNAPPGENDGATGSAGVGSGAGGSGSAGEMPSGAAGSAGAGGAGAPTGGDAGLPQDAAAPFDASTSGPDAGDAGTD
jgi:hypothetical protein